MVRCTVGTQPNGMATRKERRHELRQIVAQNVRVYRAAKRLSQESLAELSGVQRTYVGAIERCEVDLRLSTLAKLARGLEIEAFRLLVAADRQLAATVR